MAIRMPCIINVYRISEVMFVSSICLSNLLVSRAHGLELGVPFPFPPVAA